MDDILVPMYRADKCNSPGERDLVKQVKRAAAAPTKLMLSDRSGGYLVALADQNRPSLRKEAVNG